MPVLIAGAVEFGSALFAGGEAALGAGLAGEAVAEGGAFLGAETALGTGASAASLGELGAGAGAGLLEGGAAEASVAALGGGELGITAGGVAPAASASGASIADLAGGGNAAFAASPEAAGSLTNPATFGNIAGGSGGSTFGNLVGGATNAITANPLQAAGLGVGAGALGYNLWKGSQDSAERKQLGANAAQLGAQGKQLMSYLQSGTLPAGLQMQVQKANEAAKARVIQNHAKNGMPTDPSQNSALAQELNSIDERTLIETATIGERLLTTGINEVGMADDLYAKLIGIDKTQAQSTGLAISNFAAALAGKPPGQVQQPRAA